MPVNPLSADHIAAAQGNYEPKRKNNFVMEFEVDDQEDREVLTLSIKTGFMPEEENEEGETAFGNERRYWAGRAQYSAGTVSFNDYVDTETLLALKRWRRLVYNEENGAVGLAADYKKTVNIVTFGPDGSVVRTWQLSGCFPRKAKWGEADYASSEQVAIEVEFRYDKATLLVVGPGEGVQNALI